MLLSSCLSWTQERWRSPWWLLHAQNHLWKALITSVRLKQRGPTFYHIPLHWGDLHQNHEQSRSWGFGSIGFSCSIVCFFKSRIGWCKVGGARLCWVTRLRNLYPGWRRRLIVIITRNQHTKYYTNVAKFRAIHESVAAFAMATINVFSCRYGRRQCKFPCFEPKLSVPLWLATVLSTRPFFVDDGYAKHGAISINGTSSSG